MSRLFLRGLGCVSVVSWWCLCGCLGCISVVSRLFLGVVTLRLGGILVVPLWCLGQFLSGVKRVCLGGVSVVSWLAPGRVRVVSAWCLSGVLVVSWWYVGCVSVVSCWYLGGVPVVSP